MTAWKEEDLVPIHPHSATFTVDDNEIFHVHFYQVDRFGTGTTGTYVTNVAHHHIFFYPERVTGRSVRLLLQLHRRGMEAGAEDFQRRFREFLDVPSIDEMRHAIDDAVGPNNFTKE